jgi:C_GCAxxG_C_C family probable redox protein
MATAETLKARIQELAERDWDLSAIEVRFNKLCEEGISREPLPQLDPTRRQELLDRVQRRAEEYCYLMRNCARGTAAALFEEFGLGNLETIKALAAFPGIGMTGGTCGAVSGGLLALGLFFSNEDLTNYLDPAPHLAAREFTHRFEGALGSLVCADIQKSIFGKYFDPLASFENLQAFNEANAREKCPLAPGIGARIAAEIILAEAEKDA